MDVKGRTAELGPVQFGDAAIGNVERWIKWSFKEGAIPPPLGSLLEAGAGDLVRLDKNRILRRVRLDSGSRASTTG